MSIFRPYAGASLAAIAVLALAACATAPATETPAKPAPPAAAAPAAKPAAPAAPAAKPVAAVAPAQFGICAACHGTTADAGPKLGPNLFGVVGRKAGTAAGYDFSDEMKASGLTWNAENLAKFLHEPEKTVPGNSMDYPGVSDATVVKAMIDYMATLK